MKKTILILLTTGTLLCSCTANPDGDGPPPANTEAEVEITLNLPQEASTRSPEDDPGVYSESHIREMDLLVFKDGKYLYRRPAYRTSELTNSFRATLPVDDETLCIYLFANCRERIEGWDPAPENDTHRDESRETVVLALVDVSPADLLTAASHRPLPMWGVVNRPVKATGTNEWKNVPVMRSVASADVFVKKGTGTRTAGFKLTDAYLYFTPDKGYLGIRESNYVSGNPFGVNGPDAPAGMKTTLRIHSSATAGDAAADSIAHKLFLYDNNVTEATADKSNDLRFTRMVVGGYYTPDGEAENTTVKSYYPIDFVSSDGAFRRITRNWKYVFNITGVIGPGYRDPDIAAESYPVDLNVTVIPWNRDHLEIGQDGPNYLSIARKYATLPRNANSLDIISACGNIPAEELSLKFDGQPDPAAPYLSTIENDDFIVTKVTGSDGTLTGLRIEARHDYDPAHHTADIVLKHRVIRYEITITQKDKDPSDWEFGGEDNPTLG